MKRIKRVSRKTIRELGQVTTPTITTILMRDFGLNNVAIRDVWPCDQQNCRFAGPAYTIRYLPIREDLKPEQYLNHKDNVITPAVETMPKGCVAVLDANGRNDVGMLGGNLVTRMHVRGVAGVVTDGGMRDIPEIAEIGLPTFVTATAAPPSFTKLMAVDTGQAVSCGGVSVYPGDIIVADAEGVVCVPAAYAATVAKTGLAMDHLESYVQKRLARGEPIKGLYPPSDRVMRDYEKWVAAGEPLL